MARVRVAACQINTVVGDLDGNADRILAALETAEAGGADLAVFPELTVTGYPPEDLLSRPAFVADNQATFAGIAARTGGCAAVIGYVDTDAEDRLFNAAAVCHQGRVVGRSAKRLLPNYGVFDEQRWFTPALDPPVRYLVAGVPVGVTICEDMWFAGGPMADQARAGARLLVNLNASPYSRGRRGERLAVLTERATETGCSIVYVNQVGGQDELVFDGASLIVDEGGTVVASASQFSEQVLLADVEIAMGGGAVATDAAGAVDHGSPVRLVSTASRSSEQPTLATEAAPFLGPEAEVYEALVLGTRDYLAKNGFADAVIGLSGGIDSSLVAAIAVDALGPGHVHGVTMPSRYSSDGSVSDAVALAANLGVDIATMAIEPAHRALGATLSPLLGGDPVGLTDENLQSRIRGVLLMALSNANGWIVLTTGNKSEMATGYSTLYGDSAGGFAVIKDVSKTLVYDLCRYRNQRAGFDLIPGPVLVKAPSAELRPDQRDEESLPPYSVLDPVMAGYVEDDRSADDLIGDGFDPEAVARVVGLIDRAEYKRRQMPPGVRISGKAFGKDRRMPIANHYPSEVRDDLEPGTSDAASGPAGGHPPLSETTEGTAVSEAGGHHPGRGLHPEGAPAPLPQPLEATAALVGEYRWIEHSLYRLLGDWVTAMPIAAVQIHLDGQSMRHAWHADLWAERLPVLSGVDPEAWTAPSAPSAALFATLTGTPLPTGPDDPGWTPPEDVERPGALPALAGLYRVALPRLVATYQSHLRLAGAVTDGPVIRALQLVLNDEIEDWQAGERLVQRLVTRPHDVVAVHAFLERLETAVVGAGASLGLVTLPGPALGD